MTHSSKKYNKKLYLWLLFSCASYIQSAQETTNSSQPEDVTKTLLYQAAEDGKHADLHSQLLLQINMIETACDTIGQIQANINNFNHNELKKAAQIEFLKFRQYVSSFKDENVLYVNKEQVIVMTSFVNQITDILNAITTDGIEILVSKTKNIKPKKRSLDINIQTIKTITSENIQKILQEIDQDLKNILKKSDELGLSSINKTYRKVRSFWTRNNLTPITERLFMYPAIFSWIIYCTSKDQIERFPLLPKSWNKSLASFKDYIQKPSSTPDSTKIDIPQTIIGQKENGEFVNVEKNSLTLVGVNSDGTYDTKKGVNISREEFKKQYGLTDAQVDGLTTTVNKEAQLANKDASNTASKKASFAGELEYSANVIVRLVKDGSLFQLPIHIAAANYIKNDLISLGNKLQNAKKVIDDKLYGSVKQHTFTEMLVGTDRFKDVVGRDYIKSELNKVIDYVCNPEKYDRANITVEKGFLFTGPSQNGKSAMVRAFANELTDALARAGKPNQVRVHNISIVELLTPAKDGSPLGLSSFIKLAENQGVPVVLVIDEFDMLSVQRDRDNKMLADILTAMSSGLSASERNMVIIFGLTNRPQNLDFALLQHGRFGKQFKFDKPTYSERVSFFVKECERRSMDPQRFDIVKLAQETEGASFGTLLAVTKRAFLLAKENNIGVRQEHFEQALDTEAKNIVFTGEELPQSKQIIIATHNAGKALVSYLLQPTKKLCKVTTLPCTQEIQEEHITQAYSEKSPIFKQKEQNIVRYGNIFSYSPEDTLDMDVQEELIKQCKILIAGNIAQKVSDLKEHAFDKKDKEEAYALARKITFEGLEALHGISEKATEKLLTQALELLTSYESEVKTLLIQHKKALNALTAELLKNKILTGEEVATIIENAQ